MKYFGLFALGTATALLAACSTPIPDCKNPDMDKCGHGTVYSEERTALGEKEKVIPPAPVVVPPAPAPVAAPEPAPAPAPEPVATPAPAPVDTTIMREADEPDLTK